jgi:hypothetical protein
MLGRNLRASRMPARRKSKKRRKTKSKPRRILKIPAEYLEAAEFGNVLFPHLFQFENGLRLAINKFLSACYGPDWWDVSLKTQLPRVHEYAENQQTKRNLMPWIGDSARVTVLRIHLVTLGQLEEIVRKYRSDCIPDLFPTLDFFTGHMEVIKRVRNMYSHMFPCITKKDCRIAKNEIATLATHINEKL